MSKGKRPSGCDVGCGLLIVAMVAAALVLAYQQRKTVAPFKAMQEQAKAVCAECFSSDEKSAPYRRGKVLVVEADTGKAIATTMTDLPEEIRATSPEEVSMIVCCGEVQRRTVGTYSDGAAAYRLYRDICIYDLTMKRMTSRHTLSGDRPPEVKSGSGSRSGSDPAGRELISLLEELPVK